MPQAEAPNPERKSNNAMLCFCIGVGLLALAWFMGVGSAFSALFSGSLAGAAMGAAGAVGLMLAACFGMLFIGIGAVWILIRVIADQAAPDRYKDVQR
ncbi:MAG TPA: hypothetical protein VG943_00060 [Caulobacterales bacterium]|nr:hypothetical protein [Caulobacterales bacterium]